MISCLLRDDMKVINSLWSLNILSQGTDTLSWIPLIVLKTKYVDKVQYCYAKADGSHNELQILPLSNMVRIQKVLILIFF